ncbi:EFR1 family ferrodoxin [Clostridium manihotivorum]|uniref:4Fe-4S ferredoxin n=1 Tax=Clostridium manihotivorum TaxID=2320868 RepID=A0A410DSL9_9CLOT|nr:EFR1 family ferrodoxin [Clostridium manihotivorum]QAA32233.1 4Fe-4S ferredoxin [Clostridium manihotivorum]
MVIDKDTILYCSGTGNSLQVAKDINSELGDLELCNISSIRAEEKIRIEGKVFGIVFPVIYARLPLILERVLERLEISEDSYVFAVATHGGAPAEVLSKLKKVLQSKGITLNSGFLIHMPGNNIFAYGPDSTERQNKLFQREKKKVKKITDIIKERKNCKCELSKLVVDILIDRAFIKTTDKIVKNLHLRDKDFWVNDNCSSCKLCERICPVNNIQFNKDKPTWKHNCQQCTACIQYCPVQAIQWGNKTIKRKRYTNPNIKVIELIGKSEA